MGAARDNSALLGLPDARRPKSAASTTVNRSLSSPGSRWGGSAHTGTTAAARDSVPAMAPTVLSRASVKEAVVTVSPVSERLLGRERQKPPLRLERILAAPAITAPGGRSPQGAPAPAVSLPASAASITASAASLTSPKSRRLGSAPSTRSRSTTSPQPGGPRNQRMSSAPRLRQRSPASPCWAAQCEQPPSHHWSYESSKPPGSYESSKPPHGPSGSKEEIITVVSPSMAIVAEGTRRARHITMQKEAAAAKARVNWATSLAAASVSRVWAEGVRQHQKHAAAQQALLHPEINAASTRDHEAPPPPALGEGSHEGAPPEVVQLHLPPAIEDKRDDVRHVKAEEEEAPSNEVLSSPSLKALARALHRSQQRSLVESIPGSRVASKGPFISDGKPRFVVMLKSVRGGQETAVELDPVFHRFQNDGEIHKDSLVHALETIGMYPVRAWMEEVWHSMTHYTTLDLPEFAQFVDAYQERYQQEIVRAFDQADTDGTGALAVEEVSKLFARLGIRPMSSVIEEILDEVDQDGSGAIEMHEFDDLWSIFRQREGFSKSEYDRLMQVFHTFDTDGSGTLEMSEAASVIKYLAYSLTLEESQHIFSSMDVQVLNQRQFILFMRKVREQEVGHIEKWINQDRSNTVEVALFGLLMRLGYLPDHEAVLETAEDAGIPLGKKHTLAQDEGSKAAKLSVSNAWRFLEVYRKREGFTRNELAENKLAFEHALLKEEEDDKLVSRREELTTLEAKWALEWLGWKTTHEVQQQIISEVDFFDSGSVSLTELHKMVRLHVEREVEEVRETCKQLGLETENLMSKISEVDAKNALVRLGCDVATLQDSSIFGFSDGVDIYSLWFAIRRQRRAVRRTCRQNQGFRPKDLEAMLQAFQEYDPVGRGDIPRLDVLRLLKYFFPEFPDLELRDLVQEVDAEGDSRVHFQEFVALVREVNHQLDKKRFLKEREVQQRTGFSQVQIRSFREVFINYDQHRRDALSFDIMRRLVSRVVPLGDRLLKEFQKVFVEIMRGDGHGEADFSDFLVLMKHLLDCNFGGIKNKTAHFGVEDTNKRWKRTKGEIAGRFANKVERRLCALQKRGGSKERLDDVAARFIGV